MKNFNKYIFEKLHINKNMQMNTDIEYIIYLPESHEFNKYFKNYFLAHDIEFDSNVYIFSFDDLLDIYNKYHEKTSYIYVCKFNQKLINKLNDIRSGKIKYIDLRQPINGKISSVGTIETIIKNNGIISEKLHIDKDINVDKSKVPMDKQELHSILRKRIIEHGRKKSILNLNDIDVSNITDMSHLFSNLSKFGYNIKNIDISKWNISNVEDISYMFTDCYAFNADLSKLDISNVKNAMSAFMGCKNFNSDLSSWNPKNITNAIAMFAGCEKLNFDISKWTKPKHEVKTKWMLNKTNIRGSWV